MIKILLVVFLIGLVVGIMFVSDDTSEEIKDYVEEIKEYQGPVRPTDNESYFRETGITKEINK